MNRSVGRGLCLSPDERQRNAGFRVAIKPMMRRGVNEGALANINVRARSTEHRDAHTRLVLGLCSFAFKNSRAALHPISLPRSIKDAASLAVDPSVKGNEIHARTVG